MKTFPSICKWIVVSIFLSTVSPSSFATTPCSPAPSGLVAWWPGEGNGADIISSNTAALESGVTFGGGEVAQAFQLLNGTNGFMHVPASPSLNVGAGAGLTVEGWIKVSSVDGLHPIFEWHGDDRYKVGVQLWINSSPYQSGSLFGVLVETNGAQHYLYSPAGILLPDVFQHVAITYDRNSGIGAMYINGAVVAQENVGSFVPLTTYDLWIGHRIFDEPGDVTYGTYFGGLLDEFSIYNRGLSSNEIAAVYGAGAGGKCPVVSSVAPTITKQPTNQTVTAGANVTFSVTATGTAPLHYQWWKSSGPILNATNATFTLVNVQSTNSGIYYAVVANAYGSTTSSNAILTVTNGGGSTNSCVSAPSGLISLWKGEGNTQDSVGANNGLVADGVISYAAGKVNQAFHYSDDGGYVTVPASPSLDVGQGAGFTLEAWIQPTDNVNQRPIFEWQYDTNNDHTGAHFWISAIGGSGCLFANIVDTTNNSHWFYSAPGIITTDYQHVALTYSKSNGLASLYRNGILVAQTNFGLFTPNTTGNLLLGDRTYLGGATQFHYVGNLDEMSIYSRALTPNEIALIYQAGSGGKCGITNSGVAPVITHQPTNQTVAAGGTAHFTVTATGSPTLHYQWYYGQGTFISSSTNPTLTLSNVQPSNAGHYFVIVTNQFGSRTSSNAVLTVTGTNTVTDTNTPGTCTPPPSGLVAWWKGEGNANDSTGTNNGTLLGDLGFAAGEVGQAFNFTDNSGGIRVPPSPSLAVTSITIEAWINPTGYSDHRPILEYGEDTGMETVQFMHGWNDPGGTTPGALYGLLRGTNGTWLKLNSPGGIIPTGQWSHVAMTFNFTNQTGTLYLNGEIVGSSVYSNILTLQTASPVHIGYRPDTSAEGRAGARYSGGLDEVAVYNRALTPSEIAALYHAGAAGKCAATESHNGPVITHQPTNQTVSVGGTAHFTVTATGSPTLHYQWYRGAGTFLSSSTNSTLTLSNVQPGSAGTYYVVVTNQYGSATSSNAVLTVAGGGDGTNSCVSAPSGLISLWKGEGNTQDSTGSNNGLVAGGVISYAAGKVNQAFHYHDGGGYVTVPASPSLDVGQGAGFTLEAWIQPADAVNQRPIFEWQYNTNNDHTGAHFWISAIGGSGCLFANIVDTTNNAHWFYSAPGIITTNYQHVALTYSKSNGLASLYRNGILVAQTNLGLFTPNTTGNLLLGNRTYLGGATQYHYAGNLDEMSLYSRALASNEIAAIYQAGSGGKCGITNSGLAPVITHQPTNQTVAVGGTAHFTVTATGSPTLHYQWYRDAGIFLSSSTNSTLTLSNVQPSSAGTYYVVVTNNYGSATSSNAVLTVNVPVTCTPPPSGLVGWWKAEGNGNDSVGTNNGTLLGELSFTSGKVGQAFNFTNGTEGVRVDASPSLTVQSITIEAWINPTDVADHRPILEYGEDTGMETVQLMSGWNGSTGTTPGALYALFRGTNDISLAVNSPEGIVPVGQWSHVAITFNFTNQTGTLYLNGTNVGSSVYPGVLALQTAVPVHIGYRPDTSAEARGGSRYAGALDEVGIYNRALSQSEIAAIYHAGAFGKCASTNTGPPQGGGTNSVSNSAVINSQPTVNLSVAGKASVLTWPVWAGDFTLQAAGSLTPPITWTNVPITLETNGDNIEVTLPADSEQMFFRLYRP
jgi:hypothetical protein